MQLTPEDRFHDFKLIQDPELEKEKNNAMFFYKPLPKEWLRKESSTSKVINLSTD